MRLRINFWRMLGAVMPMTLAFLISGIDRPAVSQPEQQTCYWQLQSTNEAIASGGGAEGMTASRNGNTIVTSYTHGGNFGCQDQTFQTTHSWTEPGEKLTADQTLSIDVSASWNLDGTAECTSLTAGINTYVQVGDSTVRTSQNQIIVSANPSGSISSSGSLTIPAGSSEGEQMSIVAHGETGGLGGSVFYKYQWVCEQAEPTAGPTETSSPSPTPEPGYRIRIDPPPATDPLHFTIHLEKQSGTGPDSPYEPVPGAKLRVFALSYRGNDTRLADEFLAPACQNCKWRKAGGNRLGHLPDAGQPVTLKTDAAGEAEITFFLDFSKLGKLAPKREVPLEVPVHIEYHKEKGDKSPQASADYSASLNAIAVVTAITYQGPQMFDAFDRELPRTGGPLESYYDDPGTRDGPRTLSGSSRVLIDWPGRAGIGPTGTTPGTSLSPGALLHTGDRVTIIACDMVTNRVVNGLPAGAPGVVWVKVRFFDGTKAKAGVNGSVCRSTVTFGGSPGGSGWLGSGDKFFYLASKGAVNMAIGYYLWPYKIVSGLNSASKFLAWIMGNQAGGWSTVYIQVKSELVVDFDETGGMHVTTVEGEPVLYTLETGPQGVPVTEGQTAHIAVDTQAVDISPTDPETARQAREFLDSLDEDETPSGQPGQNGDSGFSFGNWKTLAILGLVLCLCLLSAGGITTLAITLRKRQGKPKPAPQKASASRTAAATPRPKPAGKLDPDATVVSSGSAGGPKEFSLAVIAGPDSGKRYFPGVHTRLGRAADNDISINDSKASRYHAQIRFLMGEWIVNDMGSANGTFVNDTRIEQPTSLKNGDTLRIGTTTFRASAVSNKSGPATNPTVIS